MKRSKDTARIQDYINSHDLTTTLPIDDTYYLMYYEQGEQICSQGDELQSLAILVEGKVKIYTTSMEGRHLILSFKNALEVIGDIEYIQKVEILNTVEAVTNVVMLCIPLDQVDKLYEEKIFLHFILQEITRKFYNKSHALSLNVMHPVEMRLASYIVATCCNEGHHRPLATAHLPDVASFIGTSYRHINRVIQKLCERQLLERTRECIYVKDEKELRALANDHIYGE
ncbi:catabolite gene activator protein [Lysinibacillus alkalisoli]|uniref:Catabolite gene activator protein n=1 Tax=Lysinibacillus alkalisoli TaxID=1911548 RepID=A0A917G6S8_9BACI|nr:cyclic nucleotide-binding domain-containing protein [Lysinibacillus alkalisoli]GGG25740.1 catabolite gene activator protein [Lysinibacillus alkalisoli]